MSEAPAKPKERFLFIDGLRALAALGVMCHHLYSAGELEGPLKTVFPGPLKWIFVQDLQRVQVFFVISGFVIAWSLRNMLVTTGSAANFILRRQVRLDPAYWIILIIAELHMIGGAMIHPAYWKLIPGPGDFLANVFYLHKLLGKQEVMSVSWSLCLEVQLYLVYIIVLYLIQRTIVWLALPKNRHGMVYTAYMFVTMLLSLWLHLRPWAGSTFVFNWYLFAMGAMVCWVMEGRISGMVLLAFALLEIGWTIANGDAHVLWCPGIAGLIYLAWRTGNLTRWLNWRFFQYIGRISYSLFLVHWDVGKSVMRVGIRITGMHRWPALFWFGLAILASIGAAHLMNVLVEQPSMRLAARLKPRPPRPAPVPEGEAPVIAAPSANPGT
jgi:peptidoglycan/LPS O-acetylase OafA/YrhL